MHEILEWGIEFILWVQRFQTPASYRFWEIFTNFGGSYYIYMVPAVLWCLHYRTGLRVLALMTATLLLNTILKDFFAEPRPFEMDPRVISPGEHGYGLPSGHAQLAIVFWGAIAAWFQRAWFWWLAVGIMIAMGFSRVVLGVHFPSDVLAGWTLGAITLWLYLRYHERLEDRLSRGSLATQIVGACAAGVVLLACVGLLPFVANPMNAGVAGLVAGGGVGAALGLRFLAFDGRGRLAQRAGRFVAGMVVLLTFLGLLQQVGLPVAGWGDLVLFLELALIGTWLTLGAPWLFERLHLSQAEQPQ